MGSVAEVPEHRSGRGRRSKDDRSDFVKTAWLVSALTAIVMALVGGWARHVENLVQKALDIQTSMLVSQGIDHERITDLNQRLGELRGEVKRK